VGDVNVRRAEATAGDIGVIAPLFDAYRQFYGLMSDPALARAFVAERLERRESVIFVATDTDPTPVLTPSLAVPQVGSLTLDSPVDKERTQSVLERALGFVQLFPSFSSLKARPLWVLNDLFVAAEGRRRGVGRALMDRARRHAEETGACRLTLETMKDNAVAKSLYLSLGYVRDPDEVEHYSLELE
jgi:ribosomal protein S18 acetylase RimI-like enzyme